MIAIKLLVSAGVSVLAALLSTAAFASAIYYDIATAPVNVRTLAANYVGISPTAIIASNLQAVNLGNPNSSDLGIGNFVFSGWSGWGPYDPTRYFQISLTPSRDTIFDDLQYTFFSGNWSDMNGPHGVWVLGSTDDFATTTIIARHPWADIHITDPREYCPNNFVDDLSFLGSISAGKTLTIRILGDYADYGFIPAGLWNKDPRNYNLTVNIGPMAAPEPNTLFLAILGGFMAFALSRRAGRSGGKRIGAGSPFCSGDIPGTVYLSMANRQILTTRP